MDTKRTNAGDYADRSRADAADDQREQRHLNEAKTKRRVTLIAIGIGLLSFSLIGVLAAATLTPATPQPKPGATATRIPEATNPDGKPGQTVITGEKEFWEADGKAYAVDLEKWHLAPAPTAPTSKDFTAVEQRASR
ncbi:hypothetical protein [Microbacterium sp. A1-JK]|uniref:hypothetical protein n=1 Tax=Microbacterium sp. A1-JK TaxID=3177516 RepID=UPI00388B1951